MNHQYPLEAGHSGGEGKNSNHFPCQELISGCPAQIVTCISGYGQVISLWICINLTQPEYQDMGKESHCEFALT
jgi:hypothetical protein